jgi:hypothetical protein
MHVLLFEQRWSEAVLNLRSESAASLEALVGLRLIKKLG